MPDRRRALIIEDDPDIRATVGEVLAAEGYTVTCAADGCDGLRAARRDRPDVILLDLMMPRMDGWTFRSEQQKDPAIARIPVVVFSAAMPQDVEQLAAAAYLPKPFTMNSLLASLEAAA